MDDQAVTAKLAAALFEELPHTGGCVAHGGDCLCVATRLRHAVRQATALLPAVRGIAADELRAAYIENRTTVAKLSPVERLTCLIVKMEDLVVRADALDGKTP